MTKKVYKIAIIGAGIRGANVYGEIIKSMPEMFEITAVCDRDQARLNSAGKRFKIEKESLFCDEEHFFEHRRADVLIIATQDAEHFRQCKKAFELGYDVLLEKPISDRKEECEELLKTQSKYGNKVLVCHVLRYSAGYQRVAEIINQGKIGRLVAIDWIEYVGYLRQAHSYVRGNWRNDESATPMILAKSCHDLDLIQRFAGAKCKTVSSVGDLSFFKSECAPDGAAKRCTECRYVDTCPYSAKRIYIDRWYEAGCPDDIVPYNVIAPAPATEDKLKTAIKDGPYGRCVFHCDNNVVDHQMVQMVFENGVKASFTMMAFSSDDGRKASFFGTLGEIKLDEKQLILRRFGEREEKISLSTMVSPCCTHGGGDNSLIKALYDMLEGKNAGQTSLEASVESHLIGIAAEKSRKSGGEVIKVH
jgi:predicted dehydrogenase